jgi:hypothetical protein
MSISGQDAVYDFGASLTGPGNIAANTLDSLAANKRSRH